MSFRTLFVGLLAAGSLAACGGGGSSGDAGNPAGGEASIINKENYVDVAGLSLVAASRIAFLTDLIDQSFEAVIASNDTPGTYPCLYGGTASYTKSGSTYNFTAANCDTLIAGERVVLISASMQVSDPVIQPTGSGYFLTSAAIRFNDSAVAEAGGVTRFTGNLNMVAAVTSPTTAEVNGVGDLDVRRAGRTDSYRNIDVVLTSTVNEGQFLERGSLLLSSQRFPAQLSVLATGGSTDSLTVSAADGSQSMVETTDYVNFSFGFLLSGAQQDSTTSSYSSGPLADAIERALQ